MLEVSLQRVLSAFKHLQHQLEIILLALHLQLDVSWLVKNQSVARIVHILARTHRATGLVFSAEEALNRVSVHHLRAGDFFDIDIHKAEDLKCIVDVLRLRRNCIIEQNHEGELILSSRAFKDQHL